MFVVETKNYGGRIYGNQNQHEWTQVLAYGKVKNRLYNPLKQNYTHMIRLKSIISDTPIYSIVIFVQNNIKFIEAENVVGIFNLKSKIRQLSTKTISVDKMNEIYNKLIEIRNIKQTSDREHIQEIKELRQNVDNGICPRCGGLLVKRQGKYGEFEGCENYPKCRFIKK